MSDTMPRAPEPARRPEVHVSAPRGRLRQALRCPFCHDGVGRSVVACLRPGCGALYHSECWAECQAFDGCAAIGCGSREGRVVGPLGYVVRWLRLALAALLLPRRAVRALRAAEGLGVRPVFEAALARARPVLPSRGQSHAEVLRLVAYACFGPLAVVLLLLAMDRYVLPVERIPKDVPFVPALPLFAAIALTLALPFLVAFAATFALYAARGVARALLAEVAALERADAPASPPRPRPVKEK